MRIIHYASGIQIGGNIKPAISFWSRFNGFMFRKSPKPFDGIYFPKCNWVHNCFVRFPLDLVFIRDDGHIVDIVRGFKPWRFSKFYFEAQHTIEFATGVFPSTVGIGDRLVIEI